MQSTLETLIDKHYAHTVCVCVCVFVCASAYNFTTSEKYVYISLYL